VFKKTTISKVIFHNLQDVKVPFNKIIKFNIIAYMDGNFERKKLDVIYK